MSETVYHVTTAENATLCLQGGIVPFKRTRSWPTTLQRDELYDDNRPVHIVDLDIRRTNSVYAHVGLEHTRKLNGGWLHTCLEEKAVLAITIPDPTKVYVADALLNDDPYTANEFWASVMSLQFYLQQLRLARKPTYKAPSSAFGKQFMDKPEKWNSYYYMWPEVLIPNGVDASAINIVDKIS